MLKDELSEDLGALMAGPQYVAERLSPTWVTRPHVQVIAEALQDAVTQPGSRTAVICPPQVGKSTLCSIWAPFWLLMGSPLSRIMITSYGQRLADRNGRAVRNLVRDEGHRWGRQLASDARAVSEWSLTQGGGIMSAGVGAGITGFPADVLVVDDVYRNRADAESQAVREGVWDWLSSSAFTRLAPGAPVFMIGTLWTPNDPILRLIEQEGRVENGGRWRVVHMPAIADLQLTGGRDPLGRADGDPLTHPKISTDDRAGLLAHWEDKRSGVLARDWLALYQGDPHPRDGAVVSWEVMERAFIADADLPELGRTVVAVDPSGGGADEVGIIVAHSDAAGTGAYVTHDYSGVMSVTEWPERVCDVAEQHEADMIVMETNFGAGLVPQAVRTAWEARPREGARPSFRQVRALKGKILRAEPIAQEMAMGRVRIARGLTKLASEWTSYAPGSPDSPGRLDACVYAAMVLLRPAMSGLVSEGEEGPDDPPGLSARRVPRGPRWGPGGASFGPPGGRRIPGR